MEHRKRIEELLYQYETAGLIESDHKKVTSLMADYVIGVGMGEQGFVSTKQDIENLMKETIKKEDAASYQLSIEDTTIQFINQETANVYAKIIVTRMIEEMISSTAFYQTLSVAYIKEDWYITSLHASPVELSVSSIESYPMEFAKNTLSELRAEMQNAAMDLINKSISGGIIGTYVSEKKFPLYFVNQDMLSYLGYEKEEFYQKFAEDASVLVHPEDSNKMHEYISKVIATRSDYEIQLRLKCKNGTYLTMCEHVRFIEDQEKRPVLLGVFIDITDLIELQHCLEQQAVKLEEQAEELTAQNEELTKQKEALELQAREIAVSEERYRIALEKTSNIIFDCDIESGNILHSSVPKHSMDFLSNIHNAKDSLIIGGTILEEYMEIFDQTYKKIQEGNTQEDCVVKVKLAIGKEIWSKISMTGIAGYNGSNVRCIGMIEDITLQKEAELAFVREEQYRQALLSCMLATYIVNYTNGVFEDGDINSEYCVTVEKGQEYESLIRSTADSRMRDGDRDQFINLFGLKNVMESFYNGVKELKMVYELFIGKDRSMWMETTVRLFRDIMTNDVKGYLYVNDVSNSKQRELELERQSEIDPLTKLYNKGASEKHIREKLNTQEAFFSGVFIMLDIDSFKLINDTYGHPFGDEVLKKAAEILIHSFRDTDLVGRIGGDEFCVFLCGIRSKERMKYMAQEIVNKIASIFAPEAGKPGVTSSIGIAFCDGKQKNFEQLYHEADVALYRTKERGKNSFTFSEE